MRRNVILNTDSYKYSHFLQYPESTNRVFSYIESRGGKYPATVFFGLQYIIKKYLLKPFTQTDIDQAEKIITAHGEPFNRAGFEYVLKNHGGLFPVKIKAVPEGSVVPTSNVLVTIENTGGEQTVWCTSFLETLLMRVWYPITVATREFYLRKHIREHLLQTAGEEALAGLPFKLNDFGARGASSTETAAIGGMAHLLSFAGTDNVLALEAAMQYYGAEGPVGFSIPAAEHSTMTSWGGREGEYYAMENMLNKFNKPGTLVAVVSDSYDIWNAVMNYWGSAFHERIKNSGGTVVIRPDSGDPVKTPVAVVEGLMTAVGSSINSKGYRILPPYFRVIQGDGVNEDTIVEILREFNRKGLSTDNIAFGMGGAMLQQMDRDTCKMAMKCSAIAVGDEWRDVFKEPITDKGKISKKGRLDLIRDGNEYKTVQQGAAWTDHGVSALETVYLNGELLRDVTFDQVRKVVDSHE